MPIAEITLFELLKQGGWAMYPLGILSLALFALILFTWLQTSPGYFGFRPSRWNSFPVIQQIREKLQNREPPAAAGKAGELMRDQA
ncbi:MAG TPA: hypothetical protein VK995_06410, partial [Oceanipulchritudo sp.]|nr:hypothetical protein [Oceanipulchritudo sp.]